MNLDPLVHWDHDPRAVALNDKTWLGIPLGRPQSGLAQLHDAAVIGLNDLHHNWSLLPSKPAVPHHCNGDLLYDALPASLPAV